MLGIVMSVYEVLAEPRRREILDLVRGGERTVGELVGLLGLRQPSVSKHLKVLREAGLVASRVDEQRRAYRLTAGPLRELDRWLAPYRQAWSTSLDRLEQHLDEMARDEVGPGGVGPGEMGPDEIGPDEMARDERGEV
jgi:DNA-binding transcriptional ArsR family regulator